MALDVRTTGINPNHWYVVARSTEIVDRPFPVTLWKENIVLYRDSQGKIQALEDRCPHRQVKLSEGKIKGDSIECAYHAWQFNPQGKCNAVFYLAENQKLPNCTIKIYPTQELDGFVWLFLGEKDHNKIKPLGLPEWDHLNYIASVAVINCQGHFSYLIENLMDMYHGHLHDNYQAWAEAKLNSLESSNNQVHAHYDAESYYKIDKIWSISQLFFPALRQLHPEPLDVSYIYPHWVSTLGKDFKIYCLFCPIDETHTKAYLIHFTSLHAFDKLHKLPVKFRQWVKDLCFGSAQKLLEGLILQDVKMIEQEQISYLTHPQRKNYELNPTIVAVQKLIFDQFKASSLVNSNTF